MAVYVNTNVSSLNGRRYLNNVQNQLSTTYQRLSSGMRINSAIGQFHESTLVTKLKK